MPRVKRGVTARARHKKILALAKGYRGRRKNVYRVAKQAVMKAGQYAYRDRRTRKRVFRKLWIARINAGARSHGVTYSRFIAGLKKQFPGKPFLIVRYGDHQPEFSSNLLDPGLDEAGVGKKLDAYDPRYYATYYAIDALNFEPVKSPAVMDTIDAAYLPLVIQEAAGIPLDPSFAEQKAIMLRCQGIFYACKDGAEARRLNRLLIDAGMIHGL